MTTFEAEIPVKVYITQDATGQTFFAFCEEPDDTICLRDDLGYATMEGPSGNTFWFNQKAYKLEQWCSDHGFPYQCVESSIRVRTTL